MYGWRVRTTGIKGNWLDRKTNVFCEEDSQVMEQDTQRSVHT